MKLSNLLTAILVLSFVTVASADQPQPNTTQADWQRIVLAVRQERDAAEQQLQDAQINLQIAQQKLAEAQQKIADLEKSKAQSPKK